MRSQSYGVLWLRRDESLITKSIYEHVLRKLSVTCQYTSHLKALASSHVMLCRVISWHGKARQGLLRICITAILDAVPLHYLAGLPCRAAGHQASRRWMQQWKTCQRECTYL